MSASLVARSPADQFRDLADAGENVFLTGPAGSGKSYLVRDFLKRHPDTHVTASTGVAALNVGGMTVHRWSGMLLGPTKGQDFERYFTQLARDSKPNVRAAFNRVRRCKRLVIDEISMLSGRAFGYLDFHCRKIRDDKRPFGGIQVIGTGDFLQLPPVRINPQHGYDSEKDFIPVGLLATAPNILVTSPSTGIKSLKVRYNGAFGYAIEVTKANLALVPADYIRKQTMVNAERFTTEELRTKEREVLRAGWHLKAEGGVKLHGYAWKQDGRPAERVHGIVILAPQRFLSATPQEPDRHRRRRCSTKSSSAAAISTSCSRALTGRWCRGRGPERSRRCARRPPERWPGSPRHAHPA